MILTRRLQAHLIKHNQTHHSTRSYQYTAQTNMPLIVPGLTGNAQGQDAKTQDWMNKLVGKNIGETSDATTFAKNELPKEHRVIRPGEMVTKDFKPERLNIHLGDDGSVTHVDHQ